jgi:osmoprotectant transport system ATP-binding protein
MIKLNNVSKTFDNGKHFIVDDLSLEINEGELLVVLGSSGSGKTTTLKMINRLVEPSSGTIEIDGENIQSFNPVTLRRSIGYAFQEVGLFPHMTVEENVVVVLKLLKIPYKDRIDRAHELLTLVNLDPAQFGQRMIFELSGGQQQRVGVARALANNPHYLLMDEPFGALDAITRISLQNELLNLHTELNKTILFVTHDIFEAFD